MVVVVVLLVVLAIRSKEHEKHVWAVRAALVTVSLRHLCLI